MFTSISMDSQYFIPLGMLLDLLDLAIDMEEESLLPLDIELLPRSLVRSNPNPNLASPGDEPDPNPIPSTKSSVDFPVK